VRPKARSCGFSSAEGTTAGRGHVEADDGLELGEEGRVARALEGADPVRLELCAAQIRRTERSDFSAAAAMARPVQWVTSPGGLGDGEPVGRAEHDPGSGHVLLGAVAVGDHRLEAGAILGRDEGADIPGHRRTLAQAPPPVNLPYASVHKAAWRSSPTVRCGRKAISISEEHGHGMIITALVTGYDLPSSPCLSSGARSRSTSGNLQPGAPNGASHDRSTPPSPVQIGRPSRAFPADPHLS
jgi:hypothetical protein